jgi:hypothetical protein
VSQQSRVGSPFSTAFHSLVSDLLDYGLAIEAESMNGGHDAITSSRIVNDLVCSGHGSEGMKTPF